MGWRNWSGSVACEPHAALSLRSEAEVVDALLRATRENLRVRVAASGHSQSPLVATDGLLLDVDGLAGIARCEVQRRRAWVRAGTKLRALGEPLLARGLALENLGDIDVQGVAGAVATGTHGTGCELPCLSARVSGIRLLLADASLRVLTQERTPELLCAARVSLGALGVVTALRLELVAAYRLHERVERAPLARCLDELGERVAKSRHFEFFWFPRDDVAEMKSLDPTEEPEGTPREGERVGWSSRILPSVREQRFFEMEYAVPRQAGPACFRAVRERMQARHAAVVWPVEYRTVKADDAWLSPFHARDSVAISLHQDGRKPYAEFFADVEPIFWEHGGRPHWGKIHNLRAEALRALYPRFDDFLATRASLDPAGRFVNRHLAEVLGI